MSIIKFTKDHEWIKLDGEVATVGITDYAQKQLGDVVFVELPEVGRNVVAGKEAAVVESVKAASEVYAPVAGDVVEVNEALAAKATWTPCSMRRLTRNTARACTDALSAPDRGRPPVDARHDRRALGR